MLFQSTLLMRGATQPSECTRTPGDISIHAPHARSDTTDTNKRKCGDISIHAPHARSDDDVNAISADVVEFQSTLLMRGATVCPFCDTGKLRFQSTLLMRGATLYLGPFIKATYKFQSTLLMRGATFDTGLNASGAIISIHAPHARSDMKENTYYINEPIISIHAPHARSDFTRIPEGVTQLISIHAPHARSDDWPEQLAATKSISIHAPHARSDCVNFRH